MNERLALLQQLKEYLDDLNHGKENSSMLKTLELLLLGTNKVSGCGCKSKLINERLRTYFDNNKQEMGNNG